MKSVIITLAALLLSSPALSQSIHGANPPAAYLSIAEWLKLDDQCHWDDGTGNLSHTHLGKIAPQGGQVSGPLTFQVFPGDQALAERAALTDHEGDVATESWTPHRPRMGNWGTGNEHRVRRASVSPQPSDRL